MVLNGNGTAFEPQFKPVEETRAVAAARLNDMFDRVAQHHYPPSPHEDEARDFLAGRKSRDEAPNIPGANTYAQALRASKLLHNERSRELLEQTRAERLAVIDAAPDTLTALSVLVEDDAVLNPTFKGGEPTFRFDPRSSAGTLLQTFDRHGYTEGASMLRATVTDFGLERQPSAPPFNGALGDRLVLARPDMVHYAGIDYQPGALDRIGRDVHCMWLPYDRTGTLPSPLRMEGPAIPDVAGFAETFEQVCDARAVAILAENKPINVYWSGGIDSTAVLVALLKHATTPVQIGRIHVYYTEYSISEYPLFWQDHIDGKVAATKVTPPRKSTTHFNPPELFGKAVTNHVSMNLQNGLFVTGELGDQIFGSAALFDHPGLISMPVETYLARFSDVRDEINALNAAAPRPMDSLVEMLWWWNFTCKWSEVQYRALSGAPTTQHFGNARHFFDTEDFQRWSMLNPDKRVRATAETYKFPARDYIFDYTGDADYRDTKLKVGSLHVHWGRALGIDNAGFIIKAGDTSTDPDLIRQRYGNRLQTFAA